ncbi:hypothetical protein M407DRAFT_17080 [Tulasnella calospora MUT 4182]|uniref:Uncharacterized protein n=1 Tax=Tulasnella calospora MUT 4182 TaxID=1051891 RepID=A0A0C3LJC0_9AGAM|nr:hypothetical protein M407DRAFT_17080 [Tulasnella calospora MUT 4182]
MSLPPKRLRHQSLDSLTELSYLTPSILSYAPTLCHDPTAPTPLVRAPRPSQLYHRLEDALYNSGR